MTTNDLTAITARIAAAAPGQWYVSDQNEGTGAPPVWEVANDAWLGNDLSDEATTMRVEGTLDRADAVFIAHAREDMPDLVAEVTELRARLDAATRLDGATTTGDHAAWPADAGEFAARWNAHDVEWREQRAASLIEAAQREERERDGWQTMKLVAAPTPNQYHFTARWPNQKTMPVQGDVEVSVYAPTAAVARSEAAHLMREVHDGVPDLILRGVNS